MKSFKNYLSEQEHKPFLFYHLAPKTANLDFGLITPGFAYNNGMLELFRKMIDKYRHRICYEWNIFPNKTPDELTDQEIIYAINKFRKNPLGINTLYCFKFPPYKELGKNMKEILKHKVVCEIDINSPSVLFQTESIDYGYLYSNSDNKKLNREYYENVSFNEYFKDYDDNAKMVFANLNHIGLVLKDGILNNWIFKTFTVL